MSGLRACLLMLVVGFVVCVHHNLLRALHQVQLVCVPSKVHDFSACSNTEWLLVSVFEVLHTNAASNSVLNLRMCAYSAAGRQQAAACYCR